jgi:hypothetical protein
MMSPSMVDVARKKSREHKSFISKIKSRSFAKEEYAPLRRFRRCVASTFHWFV